MKPKLRSLNNIPFIACLAILLLNDFFLKEEYHNWLTGKLSDVCGLYVFASFWTAVFPDRRRTVCFTTALLFVIWKSPYSQGFIDFFSQNLFAIHRVVDFTDLIAVLILPVAFFYNPNRSLTLKLNPIPLALLSVISFCSTSIPRPVQIFTQPQYILFKSGIVEIDDSDHPSAYNVFELDSFLVISVRKILIDKRAALDDDYHKTQILEDLDLRLLREIKEGYPIEIDLHDYKRLRDSLIVDATTSVTLKLDTIRDELNFMGTRLHGKFKRLSNYGELLMEGRFKNGIEDSTWTFYNGGNQVIFKKYFRDGELIRTEFFENFDRVLSREHHTRDEIVRNKYFHLVMIALLIIALLTKLTLNYKRSGQKDIVQVSSLNKIAGTLGLPMVVYAFAKLISGLIPYSYSAFLFGILNEAIIVYVVTMFLFLFIFYFVKLRNRFDVMFYILLFSLGVVFLEEWSYLKDIS